ncbi:uncharacterized protein LOC131429154 [Malaya genurostris]|uniref:uncharacterized protein LOC131429154 n=1 Tax=Malaya genurostris TaxID=325434 RepID=UPI0026F400BA|nr:uncharacterized protein LOC131429154 [Malaya genurostris]
MEAVHDVIVLTETWLDDQIFSTQLFGHLYTVFRTDRSPANSHKTRGGGVLIAVSKKLDCYIDPSPISDTIEQLWIVVKLPQVAVSIGVIYLPPDRKNDFMGICAHVDSLSSISSRFDPHTPALLFGDYNQSGIQWRFSEKGLPYIGLLHSHMSTASSALFDGFNLNGFNQINDLLNRNARLLDLVLANDIATPITTVSSPIEPITDLDADHPAIEVSLRILTPVVYEESAVLHYPDFRRADYNVLNDLLSHTNWRALDAISDINDAVEYFSEAVEFAISCAVPPKRPTQKPPWSNSRLHPFKRARSAALRKYYNSRSAYFKRQLNFHSNRYRHYNRFLYTRYVRRTEENLRRNPKRVWSFVNSETKRNRLTALYVLRTGNSQQ